MTDERLSEGRVRWIEISVAISLTIISLASLAVALYQGMVMQRQLEASVMPVIELSSGNYDVELEKEILRLTFANNGLGPGEVKDLRFSWQGKSYPDPTAFVIDCCTPEGMGPRDIQAMVQDRRLHFINSYVVNRVFTPGKVVDYIRLDAPDREAHPQAYEVWRRLDAARRSLDISYCYCSLLGDCWRTDDNDVRRAVETCDAP